MALTSPLLLMLTAATVLGGFVKEPADVVYVRATQTTGYVECEVDHPSSTVIWLVNTDSSSMAIYSSAEGFYSNNYASKYSISSDAQSVGNYTLIIRNLVREDTGTYTCQLGGEQRAAKVAVADPPGEPSITSPAPPLVEDKSYKFQCLTVGGFPLPTIAWYLGDRQLQNFRTSANNEAVKSVLTVILSHTDHESKITCVASNVLQTLNTSLQLDVQFSPRVKVIPERLTVLKNKRFELKCDVSSNPAYTSISWKDAAGESLQERSETYSATEGVSSDSAVTCEAVNSIGTGKETSIVTVHYAPLVTIVSGRNATVEEGEQLVLTCKVDAKPPASVHWMRGDKVLGDSSTLKLPSVARKDAGRYQCVATNTLVSTNGPAGGSRASTSASVTVFVTYPATVPIFELNPSSSSGEYRAGQRIELRCSVKDRGQPQSAIRWYRSRDKAPLHSAEDGVLILAAPRVTDSDNYSCQAESSVHSVRSRTLPLTFIDVPKLVPTDNKAVKNITIGTREQQVQCVYEGWPEPSVQWFRDGTPLDNCDDYSIEENLGENTPPRRITSILKFQGKKRDDGMAISDHARYTCQATNSVGESKKNFEIQINVIFPPHFAGFGKVAVDLDTEDVVIPCEVLSYPPATSISFSRDSQPITSSDKYKLGPIQNNVGSSVYRQRRDLVISKVTAADYGSYRCEAENAEGSDTRDIALTKTSIPDPPQRLGYHNVSWDSVTLSWLPGFDGGSSQLFQIYRVDGKSVKLADVPDPAYTVAGLTPMTKYTFKVGSSNKLGENTLRVVLVISTPKLYIPPAHVFFDEDSKTVKVTMNSTEYCAKLQGSKDGKTYEDVTECLMTFEQVPVADRPYTSYRAITCVPGRPDVCRSSPGAAAEVGQVDAGDKVVIIAVLVSVFLVVLLVIAAVAVFMLRRKRRFRKSPSATKTGHINPVITSNGTPGEVQFSNHSGYNINSDLEMDDEIDGLPYGELRNHSADSPTPAQQQAYPNLDYVYASVQKKSSEQNKLNEAMSYQDRGRPGSMNIHDPSSVSDNSDADGYGEQPPSPYRAPDDLAFLGDGAMAFHRYPSLSESGYSTPDSKQLKRIVYEVIV